MDAKRMNDNNNNDIDTSSNNNNNNDHNINKNKSISSHEGNENIPKIQILYWSWLTTV